MSIAHSLGSNERRPGRFFDFNYSAAQRGLTPLTQRIALIGILGSAGTVAKETLKQVFTEGEADTYFEVGSELALMVRWAIKGHIDYGNASEIWAIGMDESTGVAAVTTLTFVGVATETAIAHIRIAGRDIKVGVANGAVIGTIASDIDDAIDEMIKELPITSGAVAGVVTCTHNAKGVNGNDVEYDNISMPAGIVLTIAQTVPGTVDVSIANCLDLLEDKDYDFVVCGNHIADDIDEFGTHLNATWASGVKRWRHTVLAERGTLATAQALATAADDYRQVVIAAEGFRGTPGEIASYVAAQWAAEKDPNLPWNDWELDSIYLPETADIPTGAELNTYIAGGLTIVSVNENQTKAKIVRAVTTKVSEASVPFFVLLDLGITKGAYYAMRQIDAAQAAVTSRAKKTIRSKAAVRSTTLATLYSLEELEIVQNVKAHEKELIVENDPSVASRLVQAVPTSIVPPLNQVVNVINLAVE